MDFIRASTKALFVEFPVHIINTFFTESGNKTILDQRENFLKAMLREILRWTQPSFTSSNIDSLIEIIFSKWMIDDSKSLDKNVSIENRLLLLPLIVGEKLISMETPSPRVKFDHLLRWRDLTFHTSEDLITIPALVNYDINNKISRNSFLWEDTLSHDADWINDIFKSGICDIHSHLSSGADPAMFNWIVLMNHPKKALQLDSYYKQATKHVPVFLSQKYDPVLPYSSDSHLPLSHWIIIAAWIRCEIFSRLYDLKDIKVKWKIDINKLDRALFNGVLSTIYNEVQTLNQINTHELATLPTFNGLLWDYAVNNKSINRLSEEELKSPFLIHFGERKLIYDFYLRYLSNDREVIEMAKYLWLYLLIRNKFRREVLNTNTLIGFTNFKKYFLNRDIAYFNCGEVVVPEDKKEKDIDDELLKNKCDAIQQKYAIQTSVGKDNIHGLEARIGKGEIENLRKLEYEKSIFFNLPLFNREDCKLSLIAQFSKNETHKSRELSRQINDYQNLTQDIIVNLSNNQQTPPFVGVDACSNEIAARPYVFGSHYRKLTRNGIINQTFHVGEDFHDMIDGLRAIDEALNHLHWYNNLRLGHALALGLDIDRYYQRRHFCAVLPRQVLLDNAVWLKFKSEQLSITLSADIQAWIDKIFIEELNNIGYINHITDPDYPVYWESFRFRGMIETELPKEIALEINSLDPKAKRILALFMDDKDIAAKGSEPIEVNIPKELPSILIKIQKSIRNEVEAREITIECNPTSNLVIGPFERYSEHPMFVMKDPIEDNHNSQINISICTDNKGIMATSIENEYSLIAAAMFKPDPFNPRFKPFDKETIIAYLNKIRENSWKFRFTI